MKAIIVMTIRAIPEATYEYGAYLLIAMEHAPMALVASMRRCGEIHKKRIPSPKHENGRSITGFIMLPIGRNGMAGGTVIGNEPQANS